MSDCGFSLTRIFPYKDRIYNSVFIRENMENKNPNSLIMFQWDKHIFRKPPLGDCLWNIRKCSLLLFCHFTIFFKAVPQRNSRSSLPEVFPKNNTAEIMSDYGFSLTHIFLYKDGIYDSVLMWENTDNRKPLLWYIFCSRINTFLEEHHWGTVFGTFGNVLLKWLSCHFTIFPEAVPQRNPRSSLPNVSFKKSEHLLRRTHLGDCFWNSWNRSPLFSVSFTLALIFGRYISNAF